MRLDEAGIERADVVVCSTDGDNTNIIVAQLAKKRFQVPKVVVRVLDPYRADWYHQQGLHTVCPTQVAIDMLTEAVIGEPTSPGGRLMYIIIAGAGKVGWNLARELIGEGHEVTLIEVDRNRYLVVEEEPTPHPARRRVRAVGAGASGHRAGRHGGCVTGDDEDNMLICQVAKEKYLVEHTIAQVNNPRNLEHFGCSGSTGRVGDGPDPAPDRARVPHHGLVHLLDLRQEQLEIIEGVEVAEAHPRRDPRSTSWSFRTAAWSVSVLRNGTGFVPKADT